MPENYVRQSSFSNGDVIDAPLFNAEFDQLVAAFRESDGHNHDGTVGGGASITLIKKGNSSVSFDVTVPEEPKIVFTVNGVVVNSVSATTFSDTTIVSHTPDGGTSTSLKTYLDTLEIAVGDAGSDAAAAAVSADLAQAAAMSLGVPVVLNDGSTYTITNTTVQADIICLGDATITLPTVLTLGHRYSIRVSSTADELKRCTILNPNFSIIGDLLTLTAGQDLELKRTEIIILDTISSTELEII